MKLNQLMKELAATKDLLLEKYSQIERMRELNEKLRQLNSKLSKEVKDLKKETMKLRDENNDLKKIQGKSKD
jgi:hypothetical protein